MAKTRHSDDTATQTLDRSIKSMTAYAQYTCTTAVSRITWEIKTVNHRYLDIQWIWPDLPSLSTPISFRAWEPRCRSILGHYIKRGRVECKLSYLPIHRGSYPATCQLQINHALFKDLLDLSEKIRACSPDIQGWQLSELLAWPGLLMKIPLDLNSIDDTAPDSPDMLEKAIIQTFETTVERCVAMRAKEGQYLTQFLLQQCADITERLTTLRTLYEAQRSRCYADMQARVQDMAINCDPQRLEQEVFFYIQRWDIQEELDRLQTHLEHLSHTCEMGGSIGRKLDFLLQEISREIHTVSSKSTDIALISLTVDLKLIVEHMREQSHNIE